MLTAVVTVTVALAAACQPPKVVPTGVRLRSAVQGSDGNLYIATDVGGSAGAIWRVVPG